MEIEKKYRKACVTRLKNLRKGTENLGLRDIAKDYREHYTLGKFHHSQIQRWENSANLHYILWFCWKYNFNEIFIIYGTNEQKKTKFHRTSFPT
ncbi:MAG: hypothetical protein KKE05_03665 [Nanoarchaeota archaeon]|nr:hypothetical protein [Nanoarchaeota archaeon]